CSCICDSPSKRGRGRKRRVIHRRLLRRRGRTGRTVQKSSLSLHSGDSRRRLAVVHWLDTQIHCDAAEHVMFPDMQNTADGRFLEFDMGDWFMLFGGFTLAGLLVWLT